MWRMGATQTGVTDGLIFQYRERPKMIDLGGGGGREVENIKKL